MAGRARAGRTAEARGCQRREPRDDGALAEGTGPLPADRVSQAPA